jgi:hypothetical protein
MAWRLELLAEQTNAAPPLPPGPARLASDPHALLHQRGEGESGHLLLTAAELFGAGWPDQPCWPGGWLAVLEALASAQTPLQLWAPLEWEPALRGLPLPACAHWRWLLIEAPFSPPLAEGDDLIAETGPWQGGFEPWSDPLVPALVRAVRRRLAAAGVGPVHGP